MEARMNPGHPEWTPVTEEDIRLAVDTDPLKETHHIDVKRETGEGKGAKRETARDIASFAIHGGALLFGVEEDNATGVFSLAPQKLAGLVEKIDNIAATAIEPPLRVEPIVIPTVADGSVGYLLARIAPSPLAPHMVDGRYYGRGERSKRVLSDGEVQLLHSRRASIEEHVGRLLDGEIDREPVPVLDRRLGHMYFVAEPINAPAELARSLTRENLQAALDLVWNTEPPFLSPSLGDEISPTPQEASSQSPRANGLSLHTHGMSGPGRTVVAEPIAGISDNGSLLDIELRTGGGIRVFVGRATYQNRQNPAQVVEYIFDNLAVAYSRRLVSWAAAIGEHTRWRGTWMFGVHIDRLRGRTSASMSDSIYAFRATAYDEIAYREITTASHLEMRESANTVARRIVGRLVETLGSFSMHARDLTET